MLSFAEPPGARRPMRVDGPSNASILRNDLIHRTVDLPVVVRTLDRDRSGTAKLQQANATFSFFRLVVDIPLSDVALQGITGRMAGAQEPVFYNEAIDRQWLKQGVKLRHRRWSQCSSVDWTI